MTIILISPLLVKTLLQFLINDNTTITLTNETTMFRYCISFNNMEKVHVLLRAETQTLLGLQILI